MAHYNLHLSEIPPRLSVSAELMSASSRKVDQHMFAKELEIISNYADEYGSTPRGSSNQEEQTTVPVPAPPALGVGASDTPAVSTYEPRRDNIIPSGITNNDVSAAWTEPTAAAVAAAADTDKATITSTHPPQTDAIPSLGNDGKDGMNGIETNERNAQESVNNVGKSESDPANDPVTVVPGVEIIPDSEQTVVHFDATPAQVAEVANTNAFGDQGVAHTTQASADDEEGISSSMKAALAIAEQAQKDEEMARLVEHDNKVSLLASKCNISRDECQFYLESTDWNVDEAINIYNSFT